MARPAEDLSCDIVLRDGSTVSIRPAADADVAGSASRPAATASMKTIFEPRPIDAYVSPRAAW